MRRRWRPADPRQLRIDWVAAAVVAPPISTPIGPADDEPTAVAEPPESVMAAVPPAVQVLPWDFRTTFPPVLPDAVEAGIVAAEDAEPENLAGLHAEHARALRQALTDLDRVHEARRRGVDPATGKAPRQAQKRTALPAKLSQEIERLERWWQTLLDTYEAAFGDGAAEAFAKAVRATHAGIEVVADLTKPATPASTLPEPTPLRESVLAGVFGRDEDGPVDPGPDEVREITEAHADKLTELVGVFRRGGHVAANQAAVTAAVEVYAANFGREAAAQLLAHCRRRAALE